MPKDGYKDLLELLPQDADMCLLQLATDGINKGFDTPGSGPISKPTSHFMLLQKRAEVALLAKMGDPKENAKANLKDALGVSILFGCSGSRPDRLQLVAGAISHGGTGVFARDAAAGNLAPIETRLNEMLGEWEDIPKYDQRNRSGNKVVRQETVGRMKNILGLVLVWLAAIENALDGEKLTGQVEKNNAKRVLSRWYIYFAHDWVSIEKGKRMMHVVNFGLPDTAKRPPKKSRVEAEPVEGADGLGAAVLPEADEMAGILKILPALAPSP